MGASMTGPGESALVSGLNAFFESHGPGLAYRLRQSRFTKQPVDVLRVLGNGVVPVQAAVAFAVLWRRLVG